MRLFSLGVFLVGVLLLTTSTAAATPLVGWKRNDAWAQEPRTLELMADPRGFTFESQRASGGDDILIGRFGLDDAEYRLDLRNQSGEGGVQTFRIQLSRLIEYRDSDRDGIYEATDATLNAWEVGEAVAPTLDHEARRDGAHELVATYPLAGALDENGAPTVALRFHLSPRMQSFAGTPMLPTETKFDVEISDVPYNGSDTQVVAEFQVVADESTRLQGASLETQAGEYRFRLAWLPTATVDGMARAVGVSVVAASDTTSGVYFSYARGARIVHDPSVGAHQYEPLLLQPLSQVLSKGSPVLYWVGFIVAAVAVGGVTYLRARRRA